MVGRVDDMPSSFAKGTDVIWVHDRAAPVLAYVVDELITGDREEPCLERLTVIAAFAKRDPSASEHRLGNVLDLMLVSEGLGEPAADSRVVLRVHLSERALVACHCPGDEPA